jgi:hypothetical protein
LILLVVVVVVVVNAAVDGLVQRRPRGQGRELELADQGERRVVLPVRFALPRLASQIRVERIAHDSRQRAPAAAS